MRPCWGLKVKDKVDVAVCVCGKKPHGDEGFERSRLQSNQRPADRTLAGRHLKLALATSE